MAVVPFAANVIIYPKNKTDPPYPASLMGFSWNPSLEIGGGPILPPDEVPKPEPPLEIWPPDRWIDVPAHPIVIPPPPVEPPTTAPSAPHEGWNWKPSTPASPAAGWYYLYVPGPGAPQPKKK